jgi:hypothetical protein
MTEQYDRNIDELGTFIEGLASESDRSAVIVGAARLDVGLERLLKKAMSHQPGGQDNLFDIDRPLGTFGAKILLAYRLGLIDRDTESILQMIRRMRNDFAHSLETASLSDGPARSRTAEIARLTGTGFGGPWNQTVQVMRQRTDSEPKAIFCAVVGLLIHALDHATSQDNIISVNVRVICTYSSEHKV